MKYYFFLTLLFVATTSCIPVKVAPNLEQGKIMKAQKFVKSLGPQYMFVFDDPKDANEFYKYVNAKYQTVYDDDLGNIPVQINEQSYFLTFYEVSKETKVVNLITPVIETVLEKNNIGTYDGEIPIERTGKWYIALTLTDDDLKDALHPEYSKMNETLGYVKNIRQEYLTTAEYIEVYLKGD